MGVEAGLPAGKRIGRDTVVADHAGDRGVGGVGKERAGVGAVLGGADERRVPDVVQRPAWRGGLGQAEGQDPKASLLSRSLPRDRVHDVNLFPNLGVAGVDDVE